MLAQRSWTTAAELLGLVVKLVMRVMSSWRHIFVEGGRCLRSVGLEMVRLRWMLDFERIMMVHSRTGGMEIVEGR